MDKNKIKSFAVWARRNLIDKVSEKANRIGITDKKIEDAIAVQGGFKLEGKEEIFKLSKKHRDALVSEIKEKGFEQVMEEVAYTWFNRFMGLRYMEVNDYLPIGIRVLSSEVEGKTEPDVLTRVSEVIDELNLSSEYIYELLDSGKTEDREEAYKYILVKQCNELGKIIPQMFEKISDYTELLLPDNLLEESSVIRKMVEDIEEDDWKEEVEIIGWMYQYYISEKKDEVFAALKNNVKITKENIPAATQLFTPKWIVKYMVENSLGRLWLEGHPNEELQTQWKYYLEEAEQELEVEEELKRIKEEHSKLKPEDIKILDPCMGSGHILVYAFDVLYEIYKTAGYSEREIPKLILQNNLYGLDIDDRAAQLASFALIMKARHYNRRLFREIEKENFELNLCSIQESNGISKEAIDYFVGNQKDLRKDVYYLIDVFTDAKEYGSISEVEKVNFETVKLRLSEIEKEDNLMFIDYRDLLFNKLTSMIKQAEIMSRRYEVCVTNPPYMGRKGIGEKINCYLEHKYPNSKLDLFSVFIEKCMRMNVNNGFMSIVTMQSWMFLNAFSKLREFIIKNKYISSILHMGNNVMGIAFGTSATIIRKKHISKYNATFVKVDNELVINGDVINLKDNLIHCNNEIFRKTPDNVIAYWISDKVISLFESDCRILDYSISASQNVTGNNDKYLRYIWEIQEQHIGKNNRWLLYAKGGKYRRWTGNIVNVIDWTETAREVYRSGHASQIIPEEYWYKKGITWGLLTAGRPSFRVKPYNSTFDKIGSTIFIKDENYFNYILGFINTNLAEYLLNCLSSTVAFQVRDIRNLPLIVNERDCVDNIVMKLIKISSNEWESYETTMEFKMHPFVKLKEKIKNNKLSSVFNVWNNKCDNNFNELKLNEEELNRIFIDIYGLHEELTPEVEDKDVTIRKADRERDIKSFISYAIGCVLGRYSIDTEGLIYAGGEYKDKWDLESKKVRKIEKDEDGNILSDSWVDAIFLPDDDNIIPITEDEYFEDDMMLRFVNFVKIEFGDETLEENLDFIADSIGRKPSETARQAIRRYFIKEFYKDHLKVYQKRPIYWMFDSGKNDGFKALIYMHRYNEQTVAKVRTDYLHTLQRKYEAEIQRLQLIADSEEHTVKNRTAAKKKIERISKQLEECREYDQVVAHIANEKISIDLDDGVKVNYAKFQGVKVINAKGKEVKMDLLAKI